MALSIGPYFEFWKSLLVKNSVLVVEFKKFLSCEQFICGTYLSKVESNSIPILPQVRISYLISF